MVVGGSQLSPPGKLEPSAASLSRMWIRFIDEIGARLGDQEVAEVPAEGDLVRLSWTDTDRFREEWFTVRRRAWVTGLRSTENAPSAIVLVTPVVRVLQEPWLSQIMRSGR